jgi:tRNA(Ile)-lysidine synthase
MALRLREDEAYLSVQTEDAKTTDVSALQNQPDALRLRVLASLLEGWGVPEPEAEHIALADKLVFSDKPSAKAAFPGGVTVSRNYKTLEKAGEDTPITAVELPCPGEVEFPQINLRITCAPAKDLCKDRDRFTVATEGNIIIRSRNSGDKLRRSSGSKSLKELFIDSKIPASQRSLIPVLADEKGIIAVYGFGADTDRLAETLPAVEIRFENI